MRHCSSRFFAELPRVTFPIPTRYRDEMVQSLASNSSSLECSVRPMDPLLRELDNIDFAGVGNYPYPVPTPLSPNNQSLKRRRNAEEVRRIVVKADSVTGGVNVEGYKKVGGTLLVSCFTGSLTFSNKLIKVRIHQDPPTASTVTIRAVTNPAGQVQLVAEDWEPSNDVPRVTYGGVEEERTDDSAGGVKQGEGEALIFVHGYVCESVSSFFFTC